MKAHYINILFFALPLNILEHNQRNHKSPTPHHPPTTRLLCECELYAPFNYDSDPQMKTVIDNFNKQTQQRFHEYDDRMIEKRKQCREQCDKEIQKIILKDKLEKQMAEQFATLDTDIQSDSIPTCVCEKSIADKTEKFCLNCGKTMGGVAPGWGLVGGLMYAGWTNYAATTVAKAATDAGIAKAVAGLGKIYSLSEFSYIDLSAKVIATNFDKKMELIKIVNEVNNMCDATQATGDTAFCMAKEVLSSKPNMFFVKTISQQAAKAAEDAGEVAKAVELAEAAKFVPKTTILTNTIITSVVAILIIVLIMVIIYLILRYRRKKKMKKKLQYIKLLEE
ncbi:rifin [Plasmodium reichenowi]|uniref:Rifin n=1 Tax=Plasmodium reichenowi TaxID=5854 RepID=A0A060RME9_PLARE|nr:rifin [Plasmodium reichenowi]